MRNIKLIIEYDGSNYAGWQKQKNAVTIQETIEKAIYNVTNESVEITGSSRTDTGVHARGFVGNFFTDSKIPSEKFREAINNKLPCDIVIVESEEVESEFHSRYCSKGKQYSYHILNRVQPVAISRNYVYHYKYELDVNLMKEASKYFIGTHDFAAFKNKGSSVKTSVRTITELSVTKECDLVKILVSADGFLYNMVRIIVGTLIEVGRGKLKPEEIQTIIQLKDRRNSGKSAPPEGLCLEKVFY